MCIWHVGRPYVPYYKVLGRRVRGLVHLRLRVLGEENLNHQGEVLITWTILQCHDDGGELRAYDAPGPYRNNVCHE